MGAVFLGCSADLANPEPRTVLSWGIEDRTECSSAPEFVASSGFGAGCFVAGTASLASLPEEASSVNPGSRTSMFRGPAGRAKFNFDTRSVASSRFGLVCFLSSGMDIVLSVSGVYWGAARPAASMSQVTVSGSRRNFESASFVSPNLRSCCKSQAASERVVLTLSAGAPFIRHAVSSPMNFAAERKGKTEIARGIADALRGLGRFLIPRFFISPRSYHSAHQK
jgi:hypothetical protein